MHTIINEWWAVATVAAIENARSDGELLVLWAALRRALRQAWTEALAEAGEVEETPRPRAHLARRWAAKRSYPLPTALGYVIWAIASLVQFGHHAPRRGEAVHAATCGVLADVYPALIAADAYLPHCPPDRRVYGVVLPWRVEEVRRAA